MTHINIKRQEGAALIVGLVLLAILTLLTASSMNSSTVSLRMADNVKQSDLAFNAAESALVDALANGGPMSLDGNEDFGDTVRDELTFSYDIDAAGATRTTTASVNTTIEDKLAPAIGEGLDAANNAGIVHIHFEMQAAGQAGRGGRSDQRMGFYIPAPSN